MSLTNYKRQTSFLDDIPMNKKVKMYKLFEILLSFYLQCTFCFLLVNSQTIATV